MNVFVMVEKDVTWLNLISESLIFIGSHGPQHTFWLGACHCALGSLKLCAFGSREPNTYIHLLPRRALSMENLRVNTLK